MGRGNRKTVFGGMAGRALVASLLMSTATVANLALMHGEAAAQAARTTFNVPAGPLSQALAAFGRQAGVQVTYLASVAASRTSPGFSGSASQQQALARILEGSGLVYSFPNATTVAISAPAAGAGNVAPDGSTVLQTIRIDESTANADNRTVAARNSRAATKLDTPLVKTARSISVVTKKEMEQRSVQDIIEAVRYSAGVGTGRSGFDPRFDAIDIRGYDATTMGDYKDGLRQPYLNYGMFRTDPYALERVEIVKGPVSVLYGAGTPAGIINKVSKYANGERIREVEALYGTETRKQIGADFGGTFKENDDLSWRVVGLARTGDTNFEIADERYFLQPSITWKPSDQTRLTVYGLAQNTETDVSINALTDPDGNVLRLRTSEPNYDYQKTRQYQAGYEFEHALNDNLVFRQNTRYSNMDLKGRYLGASSWTGTVVHRNPWAVRDDMNVFQIDNQLEWSFDTGPLSHTLLTGLDHTSAAGTIGYGFGAADPVFDLDVSNPVYGTTGPTADYNYMMVDRDLRQTGLYAIDQIEIDRWNFTLGGRYTWVRQNSDGTSGGAPVIDRVGKGAFTMQASALYAFDNGISPYASYATSFDPVTNRSATGNVLKPTDGEQFEIGVKYQPPGSDILISAVAYHLVEANKPVIVDPAAGTYRSLGEVKNKGVELEARANIADGWDIIAAYTYAHSRITAGADAGNEPAAKPEHMFSLWGNYTFNEGTALAGLSAGAGLRFTGETYESTQNIKKNDSTFYLDASVSYDFGAIDNKYDGLKASFNVRNIADQRDTVCNEGYCYLAQGRNITASLKYSW